MSVRLVAKNDRGSIRRFPPISPGNQRHDDREQVYSFRRQVIGLSSRSLLPGPLFDQSPVRELFQTVSQYVARYAEIPAQQVEGVDSIE